MSAQSLILLLLLLSSVAYYLGRRRAFKVSGGKISQLHSLPSYYGLYTALWCGIPALLLLSTWFGFENTIIKHLVIAQLPADLQQLEPSRLNLVVNDIKNTVYGNIVSTEADPATQAAAEYYRQLLGISHSLITVLVLSLATGIAALKLRAIHIKHQARNSVETIIKIFLIVCSSIAILTTIGIVLSVLFESLRFFKMVPFTDFVFGLEWSPQTAIRADQIGSSGAFGAVPLFMGTMLISFIAMVVAVPIGLMSAIYLSEYAGPKLRASAKPLLEILAGIPTVVYGFFAALTVAPIIRDNGALLGLDVASESALAAGLVMGIMIIPFVSSLSDDVINAVPQSLRDGAYAIGATQSETMRKVIFPAALPGIVGGILLAVSRAIGETMIVVMAAGLSASNPNTRT